MKDKGSKWCGRLERHNNMIGYFLTDQALY
jgi:hypothetical protein